jgi:hypothetical protein
LEDHNSSQTERYNDESSNVVQGLEPQGVHTVEQSAQTTSACSCQWGWCRGNPGSAPLITGAVLGGQGTALPTQGGGDVVTFMSYNVTGADSIKCQWIREVQAEHFVNYCAIQEHFKTVNTTDQWFRKQFRDSHCYVIPAYRLPGVDTSRGRGGLVQLALKNLAVKRTRILTKSPRIQAQILTFQTCKVLWINCYMPCDPQLQTFDDTECSLYLKSKVLSLFPVTVKWCGLLT